MVDEVARAICEAAGRPHNGEGGVCVHCVGGGCVYWETFRIEAKDAIIAAYKWHKKERRCPSFVNR